MQFRASGRYRRRKTRRKSPSSSPGKGAAFPGLEAPASPSWKVISRNLWQASPTGECATPGARAGKKRPRLPHNGYLGNLPKEPVPSETPNFFPFGLNKINFDLSYIFPPGVLSFHRGCTCFGGSVGIPAGLRAKTTAAAVAGERAQRGRPISEADRQKKTDPQTKTLFSSPLSEEKFSTEDRSGTEKATGGRTAIFCHNQVIRNRNARTPAEEPPRSTKAKRERPRSIIARLSFRSEEKKIAFDYYTSGYRNINVNLSV